MSENVVQPGWLNNTTQDVRLHIVGLHCGVTRALKLRAGSKANMPIVNTSHEALHPIQRVLKLYEQ